MTTTSLPIPTHSLEEITQLQGSDVTHIIFILDRSGSMQGSEQDVCGGFNSYVASVRANPTNAVGISYVRFDTQIELVWNDLPAAGVPVMTAEHYSPRGSTALLDAVGMTVAAVRDNPQHTYTVIVHTDGQENASREWTAEKLGALIKEKEALGNWTFAYFGAGFDAWTDAQRWASSRAQSASYDKADIHAAFVAKARVSNMMRDRKMRRSTAFGAATDAARQGATDDELADILEKEADSSGPA
jgi:hypothetical protein